MKYIAGHSRYDADPGPGKGNGASYITSASFSNSSCMH